MPRFLLIESKHLYLCLCCLYIMPLLILKNDSYE